LRAQLEVQLAQQQAKMAQLEQELTSQKAVIRNKFLCWTLSCTLPTTLKDYTVVTSRLEGQDCADIFSAMTGGGAKDLYSAL